MRTALLIFSWIGVVMGSMAILGSLGEPDAAYAVVGGLLFFIQGALAIVYISERGEKV